MSSEIPNNSERENDTPPDKDRLSTIFNREVLFPIRLDELLRLIRDIPQAIGRSATYFSEKLGKRTDRR